MPLTDKTTLVHLANALGSATGLGVRLTEQGQVTDYVSPLHLHPDPAGTALPVLLKETHRAGVYCTPLLQFYGALSLDPGRRLILGPTRPHNTDLRLMEEQLFLLRLPEEQRADYLRTLQCCPDGSAERMVWLMVSLGTLLTGAPFPAGDVFSACAKYVDENLYAPLRVEEVAAALGYSRSYLSTRFKQQAGMTLTRYILQEKVFEAQRLLQFSDESLLEIANTFGFSSQSHFQNVFKSVTGETPMAIRRRIGKSKHIR